jgi:hypothetical protein
MNRGQFPFVATRGELRKGEKGSTTMRIKLTYITSLLAAGAGAVAIAAAPTAAAANGQTCSGTICQSPGNVQINDARPPVQFFPYGDSTSLLGGLGDHGGVRGGPMGMG